MQYIKTKKAFTLIEMLIVIVIIGILAAALIPRLSSAQGRARDTARKANLQNIAAALVSYQIDKGTYPTTIGSLDNLSGALVQAGMSSVPLDPDTARAFSGVSNSTSSCEGDRTAGNYQYVPIKRNGISNAGFVLMAGTETEGGSNRVLDSDNNDVSGSFPDGCVSNGASFSAIEYCTSFTETSSPSSFCEYDQTEDMLRYIVVQ